MKEEFLDEMRGWDSEDKWNIGLGEGYLFSGHGGGSWSRQECGFGGVYSEDINSEWA